MAWLHDSVYQELGQKQTCSCLICGSGQGEQEGSRSFQALSACPCFSGCQTLHKVLGIFVFNPTGQEKSQNPRARKRQPALNRRRGRDGDAIQDSPPSPWNAWCSLPSFPTYRVVLSTVWSSLPPNSFSLGHSCPHLFSSENLLLIFF